MADVAHEASGLASPKPDDIAPQQASRPDSPVGASFASSSSTAATTWSSPTSWMRRSMLAALGASQLDLRWL
jgi:hypothetical protein